MKTFIMILLITISDITFGQYDSLFVKVANDTVKVYNTKVWLDCAFSPSYIINTKDSTINIVQKDTLGRIATCYCLRDYSINIVGIKAGHYHMLFFRSYPVEWKYEYNNPDTLILIGTLDFDISNSSQLNLAYTSVEGQCYTIENTEAQIVIPSDYNLEAYPNPFNPKVTIRYSISSSSNINIDIYNSLGQLIRNLYNGYNMAGKHEVIFDGSNLSSGIYYCKLATNNNLVKTIKIVLSK